MPWQGIWFEHEADEGKARSTEWLRGLVEPSVYPYAHGFVEAETERLRKSRDPSSVFRDGGRFSVYYSISHDGGQTGVNQQGCRILSWLFENFALDGENLLGARFSEIPVVIHEPDPAKAAALGNALVLLRFLAAHEDQAVAKFALYPWNPSRGSPRLAAEDYEKRVIEFLHGQVFYSDDVDLFDVLERNDLKAHRSLAPCCKTQIGFIESLLEWIDECWPETPSERAALHESLRRSLADEARYWAARRRRGDKGTSQVL